MKWLKRVALGLLALLVVSSVGGYVYFDRKFTPPANALSVSHAAQRIPLRWLASDGNPHAALLLPVKIDGITDVFYMQLDTGAPSTVFYRRSLQSILEQHPAAFAIEAGKQQVGLGFAIDGLNVRSPRFALLDYGSKVESGNPQAANIIGSIGTDLLEKRVLVLDFRQDECAFLQAVPEAGFADFQFRKRRILLPARIGDQPRTLLYDSGSSGYALLTGKQEWDRLKTPGGLVKVEKGNSWGRALKVMTAPANREVTVSTVALPLTDVTYVEGTSKMQDWLMRSSGMQGMVGNTLFLGRKLTLDAGTQKFKVE